MKVILLCMFFLEILSSQTVQEKKQIFLNKVLPVMQQVYQRNTLRYEKVKKSLDNASAQNEIQNLKIKYKVKSDAKLLEALKPFPLSIALGQGAMESGWGTSRFFREANNIFGVWAYGKNTPRIAALKKRNGKTIWVKKYASLEDSVEDYYLNIARSFAFSKFRELNMKSDDVYELVKELKMYSEKRELYSKELAQIIRYNKFISLTSP